jgi:hypothetical protein
MFGHPNHETGGALGRSLNNHVNLTKENCLRQGGSLSIVGRQVTGFRAGAIAANLRNLAARLGLTIGHFDVLRAIGIPFERLIAAEMEFLGCRLTVRPLTGAERRRSVIKQTRDIENFLWCFAHFSYPIQHNAALHYYIVQCSEVFKRNVTNPLQLDRQQLSV